MGYYQSTHLGQFVPKIKNPSERVFCFPDKLEMRKFSLGFKTIGLTNHLFSLLNPYQVRESTLDKLLLLDFTPIFSTTQGIYQNIGGYRNILKHKCMLSLENILAAKLMYWRQRGKIDILEDK